MQKNLRSKVQEPSLHVKSSAVIHNGICLWRNVFSINVDITDDSAAVLLASPHVAERSGFQGGGTTRQSFAGRAAADNISKWTQASQHKWIMFQERSLGTTFETTQQRNLVKCLSLSINQEMQTLFSTKRNENVFARIVNLCAWGWQAVTSHTETCRLW